MAQQWWMIESNDGYRSTCFRTRSEARFRLRSMADEAQSGGFYTGLGVTRQADDFFECADKTIFRVVKV